VNDRIQALIDRFPEHDIDGMLLTYGRSLRHITGYSGSNGCALVADDALVFITDFRYKTQAEEQVPDFQRRMAKAELFKELAAVDWVSKKHRLGIESTHLSVEQLHQLEELLPEIGLVPVKELPEAVGLIKDESEIENIRRAVAISDAVYEEILPLIKPGLREVDLAAEIEYRMRLGGSERVAFDAIVVSGERSALPHGEPGKKKIETGDLVTMDYGARVNGYCSDFTRTVVVGQANEEQRRVHAITLQAQQAAEEAAGPGKTGKEVDAVAREIIAEAGHGDHFGHGLGHGLGLEVHEGPRLSPKSTTVLKPGMITTVEPGIYVPGMGGVRIEDVVVIREEGCEVLTRARKDLIEL
jgi:Xaa-Pro aminopeptidase